MKGQNKRTIATTTVRLPGADGAARKSGHKRWAHGLLFVQLDFLARSPPSRPLELTLEGFRKATITASLFFLSFLRRPRLPVRTSFFYLPYFPSSALLRTGENHKGQHGGREGWRAHAMETGCLRERGRQPMLSFFFFARTSFGLSPRLLAQLGMTHGIH